MTRTVVQAEGLGKRYRIGAIAGHTGLRHVIGDAVWAPVRLLTRSIDGAKKSRTDASNKRRGERIAANGGSRFIWAIKDAGFDIRHGEVVGLIGRNGAGKSTLLKILARITRPTEGFAEIRGRVGSLLEVGTGFHEELSGRENIYMSGAILGMRKAEIDRKFDEIVAFAEVERFLDTALKHYSTGMQMRLAFAVAAHLEPEILFVDEVLAVGDIEFQKKCLGKMSDVARHGRTIVLVSHQMAVIRRLCHRTIWIENGKIQLDGPCQEVVSAYESSMARGGRRKDAFAGRVASSSQTRFVSWQITNAATATPHSVDNLEPVTIRVLVEIHRPIPHALHGIALYDHEQKLIWSKAPQKVALEAGEYALEHTFPMLPLRPGLYTWVVTLSADGELVDEWNCEPEMSVATESFQTPADEWTGILNVPSNFEVKIQRFAGRSSVRLVGRDNLLE
jgi:lipopolysaccharide transport system ATP-binding protein